MRVLTVTPNTAVDTTYLLDGLEAGGINVVSRALPTPGGKGNNVARVLALFGHEVTATGFAGGHTGAFITSSMGSYGVAPAFVPIEGASRICLTVIDEATGEITEIRERGATVDGTDAARLIETSSQLAADADVVVTAGSLPPGLPTDFYARLIKALPAGPRVVALDTSGAALQAGVLGQPNLIKPNSSELAELLGHNGSSGELISLARRNLFGSVLGSADRVLLSLGGDGAALITKNSALRAHAPQVDVVSTVGCGDALLAGFLDAHLRGATDQEALIRAVATGSAASLQAAVGVVDLADVERLEREVRIE